MRIYSLKLLACHHALTLNHVGESIFYFLDMEYFIQDFPLFFLVFRNRKEIFLVLFQLLVVELDPVDLHLLNSFGPFADQVPLGLDFHHPDFIPFPNFFLQLLESLFLYLLFNSLTLLFHDFELFLFVEGHFVPDAFDVILSEFPLYLESAMVHGHIFFLLSVFVFDLCYYDLLLLSFFGT